MFDGRLVGPPGQGCFELGLGPGGRLEGNGSSVASEMVQKLGSSVGELLDVGGEVRRETTSRDELAPTLGFLVPQIAHNVLT